MRKDEIGLHITQAMKSGDALRLSVFRMLSAALHNREIENRTKAGKTTDTPLTEEEVMQVVRTELKKRKDASEAYEKGDRAEAAAKERAEANILAGLLPQELSDEEIGAIVAESKASLGASTPQGFGALMGLVMKRIGGRASGDRVSAIIKREFVSLQNSEG